MSVFLKRFSILLLTLAFLTIPAGAKRMRPKPVSPVVAGGIRFSADGDGRSQFVVAEDMATGKELWKVKVFHNRIKPWLEEDVQWVFITNLKLVNNSILVRDERSRCYAIDLRKKHVKKQQCQGSFQ
jgi:hypothetical protein